MGRHRTPTPRRHRRVPLLTLLATLMLMVGTGGRGGRCHANGWFGFAGRTGALFVPLRDNSADHTSDDAVHHHVHYHSQRRRRGPSPPRTDLHATDRVDIHLVVGQRGEPAT